MTNTQKYIDYLETERGKEEFDIIKGECEKKEELGLTNTQNNSQASVNKHTSFEDGVEMVKHSPDSLLNQELEEICKNGKIYCNKCKFYIHKRNWNKHLEYHKNKSGVVK